MSRSEAKPPVSTESNRPDACAMADTLSTIDAGEQSAAPGSEPFIRNAWYVAAWSSEMAPGEVLARTLLGTPMVLWRDADGMLHALEDRCPHRQAPLSLGRVEQGALRCMYHGLLFDGHGRCVGVPGQDSVPVLTIPAFQLVEQHGFIWLWGGAPARADGALIPDTHWLDDPLWVSAPGYSLFRAPQQLIIDNLLDLSHLAFVHAATLGGSMAWAKERPRTKRHSRGVTIEHWHRNQPIAPYMRDVAPFSGPVDRWTIYEWLVEGNILSMDAGIVPAGIADNDERSRHALRHHSVQALTPETANSTHYFWALPRNYALDDANITKILHQQVSRAFEEDRTMIEAQARNIARFGRFETGAISADLALLHVRKLMRRRGGAAPESEVDCE